MRGNWNLEPQEETTLVPFVAKCVERLNKREVDSIDLEDTDLNPQILSDILVDKLGYLDDEFETNGWEMDFWIKFRKEGLPTIMIVGCGMTFGLSLTIDED